MRRAGTALRWTLLGLAAVLLSAAAHLSTQHARDIARDALVSYVDAQMRGSLTIGRLSSLSPWGGEALDVALHDPEGRVVLRATHVGVVLDPSAILDGQLRFWSGRISHGEAVLYPDDEGTPSFIRAFEAVHPSNSPPSADDLVALVEDLRIEDMVVRGDVLGLHGLRVEDLRARGRLLIDARREHPLDIQVWSGSGRLVAPFPYEARLDRIVGRVRDDPQHGTEFYVRASRGDERVRARVRYALRESESAEVLDLRVLAEPLEAETLAASGFDWADPFVGSVRGTVHLHGPVDELTLRAELRTEGGSVRVHGRLPSEGPTQVRVSSPGLHLDRVLRAAPALVARGDLELDLGDETLVTLTLAPFEYEGVQVPTSQVRGVLTEDRFVVHRAEVDLPGGRARARGSITFDGQVDLRVEGSLSELQSDANLRRWIPGARGGARLGVDVHIGPDGDLDVRGRWVWTDVAYGPLRAARLLAEGVVGGTTSAPTLRLGLEASGVVVGDIPLGDGSGRLQGGPRRFAASVDLRHPARQLALQGRAELLDEGLAAELSSVDLRGRGERWRGRLGGLVVTGSTVEVASFDLRNGPQHVSGSGRWRRRPGRSDSLRLVADRVDLGSLWVFLDTPPPIDGRVTGTAEVGGDLETQPTVEFDLTVADGRLLDVSGIDGSVLGRYRDGLLQADAGLTIEGRGELQILVHGTLDQDRRLRDAYRDGSYEATAQLRDVDLRILRWLRLAGPELQGRAAGNLIVSGALDVFDFSGHLEVPALRIGAFPSFAMETSFGYRDGAIVARAITRDDAGDLVEVEGSVLLDLLSALQDPALIFPMLELAPWRAALRMPPRNLGTLPEPIAAHIPIADQLRGSATLSIRGGSYRPHADLQAELAYVGDVGPAPCGTAGSPRASLRAELRDDQTHATLVGFLGSARVLQAEAEAPTPLGQWMRAPDSFTPPPTEVQAYVINAPVQDIPVACEYGAGPLTATLEATDVFGPAPAATLQLFSSGLHAHRLEERGRGDRRRWITRQRTPPSRLHLKAEAVGGVASAEGNIAWWTGGETRFGGELPIRWGGARWLPELAEDAPLSAFADLDAMPVGAALAWLQVVDDIQGNLSGRVVATGPLSRPQLTGEIRLADGRLEVPSIGQRLDEIDGALVFEGDRVTLQGLRVRDGEGIAQIAGDASFSGFTPEHASLRVESTRFPIRREGSILAELDGELQIETRFAERSLQGNVLVDRLHVRLSEDLGGSPQDLAPHPDVRVLGQELPEPDPDPYRVALDIDASVPISVKHSDFAAQVTARLQVVYADPSFEVTGAVQLLDGQFDVFGKRFHVERGAMIFDGSSGLDPEVNLVAVHTLRSNETVTVTASGRLSDPRVRFSSTVTSDRAEIIALLVSGDVRRETDADAERAPTDFLVGIAAGVLTLSLREQFGAAIPNIVFESNQYGGAQIRGGWRFEDNLPERLRRVIRGVYVEGYFNTTGEQGGQQRTLGQVHDYGFLLELAFPRHIVNTNTFTPPNNFSLDITWQP